MEIAAGLDAGSAYTRCMILALEGATVRYLGHGEAASSGWSRGLVAHRQRLSDAMVTAVSEASAEAKVRPESVVIGIGGSTVYGHNHYWTLNFGHPRAVRMDDMRFAVERAADINLPHDRMLLHVCPQDFIVDGRARYQNPKGATCTRLEANVHLVTASTRETNIIVSAAHQAHLKVQEAVFEALAAAYATVAQEDRSRGVAVVDIGLHSADMVVYEGDALVHSCSVPVCGDLFTKDVAWKFKVSYDDAEALKHQYGCAISGLTGDNSLIELPPVDGREPREAGRRELNEILEARADELFLYVADELRQAGMEQALVEGIVLTGGGAQLAGMCDMAERALNCPARKGLAIGIKGYPRECDNPAWATVAGLAMYSARLKLRKDNRRKAPGLLGLVAR